MLAGLSPCRPFPLPSCCFQDGKGKQRSLLCDATGPPTTAPTSAAHPKLAGAQQARSPLVGRPASPVLFSMSSRVFKRRGSDTRVSIVAAITLHHPPIRQERGEDGRPASTDTSNSTSCSPLHKLLPVDR
ncbi:hypothetical protein EYF80_018038 [Liparis tanakae]|uniref:Uncharacterized protein n=1 Tax=Liparis tanakae TaxID=230148 RepID=A0A4Z2I154_9TELE|nr:hypothetical protein EYF80_018038 [Liparis tanakae]